MKKIWAILLAAAAVFSLTACGAGTAPRETRAAVVTAPKNTRETAATEAPGESVSVYGKTFEQLSVGKDATDLTADIRILTSDTDLVSGVFRDYTAEFQKMYPNITVVYEGYAAYDTDVPPLLKNDAWGDICILPASISGKDLAAHFLSYGSEASLSATYRFVSEYTDGGQVYGMPVGGAVSGIAYNKSVFAKAGITAVPKTPDEFLSALEKIKQSTKAVPLCTNYGIGSMFSYWDTFLGVDSTGDPNYLYRVLPDASNPFSDRKDGTGPYAVYGILYNAAKGGLIETADAAKDAKKNEASLADGSYAVMALDSLSTFRIPGGRDVAYMPFPVSVNGKQYTTVTPMGGYGINIHSTPENRLAAMLYIKWLTESSGYADSRGCIPVLIGEAYPDFLSAFADTELSSNLPADAGQKVLFETVNTDSGLFLMSDRTRASDLLAAAGDDKVTFDDVMNLWNAAWTAGLTGGVTVTPAA